EGAELAVSMYACQAGSCVYIAGKEEGVPRSFNEIVAVAGGSKKALGQCVNLIMRSFESNFQLVTSEDFMSLLW
ncbi:hypothetical protein PENTCL1PPCAC_22292, partial [Pristionchus entomophagus]